MMQTSTRHSKITGDFSEQLVLYWLSKHGYECAYVDHTGIDIIAAKKSGKKRFGISVKARSRKPGKESDSVLIKNYSKAKASIKKACRAFGCEPWVAIVVDTGKLIRCYLLSLARLDRLVTGVKSKSWLMNAKAIEQYASDPKIMYFELDIQKQLWK